MEKQYVIVKSNQLYAFNIAHFTDYMNYSKKINNQIYTLEEFGIEHNLDVRIQNTKKEYIRSIQEKTNICCNIIPDYLSFESYCLLKNINPYSVEPIDTKVIY